MSGTDPDPDRSRVSGNLTQGPLRLACLEDEDDTLVVRQQPDGTLTFVTTNNTEGENVTTYHYLSHETGVALMRLLAVWLHNHP